VALKTKLMVLFVNLVELLLVKSPALYLKHLLQAAMLARIVVIKIHLTINTAQNAVTD
jgi:hypothetical protein